ncbi:MAG TPA: Ger(x)C family spore germination protein [Clostridia bacterium]|nr:Ger(x)C family spore germination protein [Clostridia bacterium]
MMRRLGHIFHIFIVLCLYLLVLPGCWSRREVDQLSFVGTVGLDVPDETFQGNEIGENPNMGGNHRRQTFRYTAEIMKPRVLGGGGGMLGGGRGGISELPYVVISVTGQSLWEAERNLAAVTPRTPFFGQASQIIMSRGFARRGVYPAVDYFLRKRDFRGTAWVSVTDDEAQKVLKSAATLEQTTSEEMDGLMEGAKNTGLGYAATLKDFALALTSEGRDPICARISVVSPARPQEAVGAESSGPQTFTTAQAAQMRSGAYRLNGAAVFRKDKLVGFLNPIETRGALRINGKLVREVMTLRHENSPGEQHEVSVEISHSQTRLKPEIKDGKPRVVVQVIEEGVLGETSSPHLDVFSPKVTTELNREFKKKITQEIEAAIRKARYLKADVFGFGETIRRAFPKEWRNLKRNWREEFAHIPVEIEVTATIRRAGHVLRPVPAK